MAALSSTTPDQKKPNTTYKYYPNVLELAAKCQVLIVVSSLTHETHHIVNREVMDKLSPNGVLINIGHGLHVNESKLVKALVEGRLGGFGIDVFEQEPYALEELFDLENVVLLPYQHWHYRNSQSNGRSCSRKLGRAFYKQASIDSCHLNIDSYIKSSGIIVLYLLLPVRHECCIEEVTELCFYKIT